MQPHLTRVFPTWGVRGELSHTSRKFAHFPHLENSPQKNATIFILPLYKLYTQVMLILILIDVQCL